MRIENDRNGSDLIEAARNRGRVDDLRHSMN
jgi:hypothetical protein